MHIEGDTFDRVKVMEKKQKQNIIIIMKKERKKEEKKMKIQNKKTKTEAYF